MKTKYLNREFSELKCGDVFVHKPGCALCMKIKPIIDTDGRTFTAIRLEDGEIFTFESIDTVYPVNCFIARDP